VLAFGRLNHQELNPGGRRDYGSDTGAAPVKELRSCMGITPSRSYGCVPHTPREPSVRQVLCHFLGKPEAVRGLTRTTSNAGVDVRAKTTGFLDDGPSQNRPLLALTGCHLDLALLGPWCLSIWVGSAALTVRRLDLAHCAPHSWVAGVFGPSSFLAALAARTKFFMCPEGKRRQSAPGFGLVSESGLFTAIRFLTGPPSRNRTMRAVFLAVVGIDRFCHSVPESRSCLLTKTNVLPS